MPGITSLTMPDIRGRLLIMSESLIDFFGAHPFWAAVIIVLMVLPMAGAVFHIVMKALGRRGIDGSPPGDVPPKFDKRDTERPKTP